MARKFVPLSSHDGRRHHAHRIVVVLGGSLLAMTFLLRVQFFDFPPQEGRWGDNVPTKEDKHDPFHNWTKAKAWLCPDRIPNRTAAVATFRLAQEFGLKEIYASFTPFKTSDIKSYFSFWPGHVYVSEKRPTKRPPFSPHTSVGVKP